MNLCTILSVNHAAHARVLAESFVEHHPGSRCIALVIDDHSAVLTPEQEPFVIVRPTDLALEPAEFDDLRSRYDLLELATALKPWLLRYMLDHHDDGDGVAYCDPDIRFFSPLPELAAALSRTQVVLTPHLTAPLPRDGLRPNESDIMAAGIYNLGFIALTAGADAAALLRWWQERLRTDCRIAPAEHLFVDQRWIDWVPGLFESVTILRDSGYNAAYWNLPTRRLTAAGPGYRADDRPLRFFHFSGYDPDRPDHLSKHQNRLSLTPGSPLRALTDDYAQALVAHGLAAAQAVPYQHELLPSGARLDRFTRSLYRKARLAGALDTPVFTPAGERRLVDWMNEPEPTVPGLTRYLYELWLLRPDFQRAFPDVAVRDRPAFVTWCHDYGREQLPIPDRLLDGRSPLTR